MTSRTTRSTLLLGEPRQRFLAVACLHDPVPVPFERVRQECLDRVLVVDEEDCRGVRHRSGSERRAAAGPPTIAPRWKRLGPEARRRPPRRGTVDRPLNARLVRVSSLIVVPALLALLFSVSATGTLPRPPLEPLFDQDTAASLVTELTPQFPSRIPGTQGDVDAALWFSQSIAAFGLEVEEDVWAEDIPELGRVELHNVVAVIPGRSRRPPSSSLLIETTRARTRPYGDNASGTAALIELARGLRPSRSRRDAASHSERSFSSRRTEARTAAPGRRGSPSSRRYADAAFAAIVLDGLGRRRPSEGGDRRGPAPLSRAGARADGAQRASRSRPGPSPTSPASRHSSSTSGSRLRTAEQGRLLAYGIAAVTLTTEERGEPAFPVGDPATARLGPDQLGASGRATEVLVGSIDASVGAAFRTPDNVFLRDRVASGWAVRLTLLIAVVPFALGALDLLVRTRRRRLPLAPAVRALRTRGPVLAVRRPSPLARRRRRDPPDRRRAPTPDIRLRRDRLARGRPRPRRHRARLRVAPASPSSDVCGSGNGRGASRRLLRRARLACVRRVRHRVS